MEVRRSIGRLLLVAVLAFGLAACGGGQTAEPEEEGTAEETQGAETPAEDDEGAPADDNPAEDTAAAADPAGTVDSCAVLTDQEMDVIREAAGYTTAQLTEAVKLSDEPEMLELIGAPPSPEDEDGFYLDEAGCLYSAEIARSDDYGDDRYKGPMIGVRTATESPDGGDGAAELERVRGVADRMGGSLEPLDVPGVEAAWWGSEEVALMVHDGVFYGIGLYLPFYEGELPQIAQEVLTQLASRL